MNYDPQESMKDESIKSELLALYNIIDWIDFALVFAIIFYVSSAMREAESLIDFPPSVIGLLLCLASLVVSVSAIIVSRLIHKKGANKSRVRLIGRYIIWGIWIPVDLYFLFVYAVGLIGR